MGKVLIGWDGQPFGYLPSRDENPMLIHGDGPLDKRCFECKHFYQDSHHGKTYYKCDLRKGTRGAGSDHRKYWPTCGKFEAKHDR